MNILEQKPWEDEFVRQVQSILAAQTAAATSSTPAAADNTTSLSDGNGSLTSPLGGLKARRGKPTLDITSVHAASDKAAQAGVDEQESQLGNLNESNTKSSETVLRSVNVLCASVYSSGSCVTAKDRVRDLGLVVRSFAHPTWVTGVSLVCSFHHHTYTPLAAHTSEQCEKQSCHRTVVDSATRSQVTVQRTSCCVNSILRLADCVSCVRCILPITLLTTIETAVSLDQ